MVNYHVMYDKASGKWYVRREGADRISGYYNTQAEAERAAKEMSANSGGGEVRIHSPEGQIRDSDTVAPGRDRFPPRDTKH